MLTVERVVALTRQRLAARERRVVVGGPLVKAAVLVPIVDRGEPYLVFAKRTDRVGTHRGQISFPGGRVDASDAGFLEAALRESEEEIGLPRALVEPLGALDDTETVATQFIITPFVGFVRAAVAWQPDGHEIDKVIEVPLAALRDRASLRVEYRERGGAVHEVLFWDYQGETIWGATARILKQYLDVLEEA
jgi:8-oxo-dGTP pyrophosphatase MutT (NUDIX family)